MRVNQVVAVLLLSVQLVGCTGWKPQTTLPPNESLGPVRVTLVDGRRFEMGNAFVTGDSLTGAVQVGREIHDSTVALAQVRTAERLGTDAAKTAVLAMVVGVVALFTYGMAQLKKDLEKGIQCAFGGC